MRKNTLIIIFLLLSVSIIYGEQKIFISAKLKGNDLRKEIIKWVKNKSENNKFESYDNGVIYLFYVSNKVIDNNSLCFDINFHIEYDKFIVDFSNIRLLNNETGDAEKLKFSIWSTLTNSGWFREYNDTITMLVEELENIIKL